MNANAPSVASFRTSWKEDFLASVVVFLVALPLSMGLALVAGFPFENAAAVGLISGIIGGIVVGALAGSPLQVSGAANGAAVMVALFITELGLDVLGLIVLLGGLIQLAAGFLRLGQMFRAVSPALIQGMLAGIGVLIFASQFHVMVDDVAPGTGKEFGGVINLWSLPAAVWKGIAETMHQPAAFIGLLTISVIMLWNVSAPNKLKLLPAPLIGVVVSTACASFLQLDLKYVPAPEQLLNAVSWPTGIWVDRVTEGAVWLAGLSLAFVAGAESLLTATAVDSMQRHAPRTRYDRELVAQGTGNILCGILGVLPISGVIVRSSANVLAGARTRLSAILHGLWLLVFIVLLPGLLRLIPVAALAAVLVYAGIKLIKLGFARSLWTQDRAEAAIYVATLGTVVVADLLTGIAVGIGLALARLLYTFSHLEVTVDREAGRPSGTPVATSSSSTRHEQPLTNIREFRNSHSVHAGKDEPEATDSPGAIHVHLKGAATFIRLPRLASALEGLPPGSQVHIYFHELSYIDHACLDLLVNWEQQHKAVGGELVIDWSTLHAVFQQHAWGAKPDSRLAAKA